MASQQSLRFPLPEGYDHLRSDVLIISEFSESVGPVVLEVHPPEAVVSFDCSAFAVRAMSVNSSLQQEPQIEAPVDSFAILDIPTDNCQAFVYKFALRDLHARGFVRPYCLSFVSPYQGKILRNFLDLETCFSAIAAKLKAGNVPVFQQDIEQRVRDLMLTRLKLIEMEETRMLDAALGDLPDLPTVIDAIAQLEFLRTSVAAEFDTLENFAPNFPDDPSDEIIGIFDSVFAGKSPSVAELAIPTTERQPHILFKHSLFTHSGVFREVSELVCEGPLGEAHRMVSGAWVRFAAEECFLELAREDAVLAYPSECVLRVGPLNVANVFTKMPGLKKVSSEDENSASYKSLDSWSEEEVTKHTSTFSSIAKSAEGFATPDSHSSPHLAADHSTFSTFISAKSFDTMKTSDTRTSLNLFDLRASQISVELSSGRRDSKAEQKLWSSTLVGVFSTIPSHQLAVIIFSILKGRPVVIVADPIFQPIASALVRTLSIFVPTENGGENDPCVLWKTTPLQFSELSRIKLVAISKIYSPLARAVEKQVCVYDLSDQTVLSVPYKKGIFIFQIISAKSKITDENLLIAHVQHCLLEIGKLVFLYFHRCCGVDEILSIPFRQNSVGSSSHSLSALTTNGGSDFFRSAGIAESDAEIIDYWTEIIREQQVRRYLDATLSVSVETSGLDRPHLPLSRGMKLDFRPQTFFPKKIK